MTVCCFASTEGESEDSVLVESQIDSNLGSIWAWSIRRQLAVKINRGPEAVNWTVGYIVGFI